MSTVAILWFGGYNVSMGSLQVGDIMAVIEYANLILLSMLMAIFVIIDIPEAIVCYARIRELLEHENTDTFPEPYASSITNSMSQSTKHSTNQGSYQTSTEQKPQPQPQPQPQPIIHHFGISQRYLPLR